MEIKILQGINLENPITTIKITTTPSGAWQASVNQLIDRIKSFHPVFLKEYKVEGNTITIQSKLPKLWKDIGKALNKLSTQEWTKEEIETYILETIIKQQVSSMSTIPVLQAAHNLGYETNLFLVDDEMFESQKKYNRQYAIGVGHEMRMIISSSSSKDSKDAFLTQNHKMLTNKLVSRLALPIAPWEEVKSHEHLKEVFGKYPGPVVIKPNAMTGGNGVTTNITNIDQAIKAYDAIIARGIEKGLRDYQYKVLIQHQVSGEDYRLLLVDGKLEIATKRIPAHIIGNGVNTIEELIEETNKDPRRDLQNPTHTLKPIKIDEALLDLLKEKGLTLQDIPNLNQTIYVRKVASMSQGGLTEDFTDQVHPQIKYLVESIAQTIQAFVLGVDIICKDISKPLTVDNGSFIEMNTMPEAYLNIYPTKGRHYEEVTETIVKKLVGENIKTNKVVIIGKDRSDIPEILQNHGLISGSTNWGLYSSGSIWINVELMSEGLKTSDAIQGLKINRSLQTIIFHYQDISEILENGTGFDVIDLLVLDKSIPNADELHTRLSSYGLIQNIEIA